jgi:hypothetical protein
MYLLNQASDIKNFWHKVVSNKGEYFAETAFKSQRYVKNYSHFTFFKIWLHIGPYKKSIIYRFFTLTS